MDNKRDERQSPAPRRVSSADVLWGTLSLLFIATAAALLTALVLSIQAGVSAYIVGEGHWSKAQQETVYALHRYSLSGDDADLQRARDSLAVPLGDLQARLALEARPRDLHGAREGFLQGRNAPDDIERMIWMFRWFSTRPYFGDAVAIWRESDQPILALAAQTDALEAYWRGGQSDEAVLAELREQLDMLDATLRPLALAFSRTLVDGSRWLHIRLLVFASLALAGMALLAGWVLATTRRRILASEGRFQLAFQNAATGMASLDANGCFVEVNPALQALLGANEAQLRGTPLAAIVDPADLLTSSDDAETRRECRVQRNGNEPFWARISSSALQAGATSGRFVVIEDSTAEHRHTERLQHLACHDALTGLINRRETEQRLSDLIADTAAHGTQHALCYIDLDWFKRVNDSCGHAAGDELLRTLAQRLRSMLRSGDALGRLGGDEFAAVLHGVDAQHAAQVADTLRRAVRGFRFTWEDKTFQVSCSIGVVPITAGSDVQSLLSAADQACYQAKRMGRNQVTSDPGPEGWDSR